MKQTQINWVKSQLLKGKKLTEKQAKKKYPSINLSAVCCTLYQRGMDIGCYQKDHKSKGYYCLEGNNG